MAYISTSAMFAVEGQRPAQASRWLTALLVIVYGIKKEKHIELQAQTYRASLPLSLSLSLCLSLSLSISLCLVFISLSLFLSV